MGGAVREAGGKKGARDGAREREREMERERARERGRTREREREGERSPIRVYYLDDMQCKLHTLEPGQHDHERSIICNKYKLHT